MSDKNYKNWQLNIDKDNMAWLLFDKYSASTNTLDSACFDELEKILTRLSKILISKV